MIMLVIPSTQLIKRVALLDASCPSGISLAWLAPGLVQTAIEGRLPHGMGVARLMELPAEWSRQYDVLGLPRPQ